MDGTVSQRFPSYSVFPDVYTLKKLVQTSPISHKITPACPFHNPPKDMNSCLTQDQSLWMLMSALVMGLNAYFPPLAFTTSSWMSLRAAISALHWLASW
ncbi:hypothetical protein DSO57_1030431 [Entomophthora muscae]|uniref:Uncharacterized protein n=1 Tax=Entomophthora muscae TaxID=34485 RepID=A0ACC2TYU0_9FUNG|nr:hypothetical protein DSO57_1030431 [Entomophthora muscae]